MHTMRQLERFWSAGQYERLAKELLVGRLEASARLVRESGQRVAVAALMLVRLDELNQGWHPLNQKLIHAILATQQADGGWGDPLVTALCLRALLCGRGQGVAVDRGMAWLADLQKAEGIWPAVGIRRTAEDPFVSACILFQLGDQPAFREAVGLDAAAEWFLQNEAKLDDDSRRLWQRASVRCRFLSPVHQMAHN